jgi:hypothetical protein
MKTIFKLKSIFVNYYQNNEANEFNDVPRVRKEFIEELKIHSYKEIEELIFSYELFLKIKRDEKPNQWKVMNVNERNDECIFFTFTCNDEKKFIKIFEKKLKKNLLSCLDRDTTVNG